MAKNGRPMIGNLRSGKDRKGLRTYVENTKATKQLKPPKGYGNKVRVFQSGPYFIVENLDGKQLAREYCGETNARKRRNIIRMALYNEQKRSRKLSQR